MAEGGRKEKRRKRELGGCEAKTCIIWRAVIDSWTITYTAATMPYLLKFSICSWIGGLWREKSYYKLGGPILAC